VALFIGIDLKKFWFQTKTRTLIFILSNRSTRRHTLFQICNNNPFEILFPSYDKSEKTKWKTVGEYILRINFPWNNSILTAESIENKPQSIEDSYAVFLAVLVRKWFKIWIGFWLFWFSGIFDEFILGFYFGRN
jgi:hypothetical protein